MQRWRSVERGVLLKFTESLYAVNEIFEVNCYKREELLESYIINFETSTDSVFEYPDSISESPIGLGVGFANNLHGFEIEEDPLIITNISPYNGSINNKLDTKEIVITFNKVLDVNSVNQESVKLTAYPVSGSFDYKDNRMKRERVLSKIVSVEENKIIIEL